MDEMKTLTIGGTTYEVVDETARNAAEAAQQAAENVSVPTKVSELDNDAGYISSVVETNNGLEQKFWRGTQDEYDAIETKDDSTMYIVTDGDGEAVEVVTSVNGKTGAVELSASDVGAAAESHTHDYAASTHTHTVSQINDFPSTETWTFTLEDGSTVDKVVYVG